MACLDLFAACSGPAEQDPPDDLKDLPGPVDALKSQLGADNVLLPGALEYTKQRWSGRGQTISWSLAHVGYPCCICVVSSAKDVQAVVNYAREHCQPAGIPLAVANGRHSHLFMPNNTIVCDMSGYKGVTIDEQKMLATFSGGDLSKDFQDACAKVNMATTSGNAWNVGLAGQILHGGHGVLERKCGMGVDNIVKIEVVTADGQLVTCTENENSDLFWAMRGAGSNFGIACTITVKLIKIPSHLVMGMSVQVPFGDGRRKALLTRFVDHFGSKAELNKNKFGLMVMPVGGPVIEMLVWLGMHENELVEAEKEYTEYSTTNSFALTSSCKKCEYFTEIQQDPNPAVPGACVINTFELSEVTPEIIDVLTTAVHSKSGAPSQCAVIFSTGNGACANRAKDSMAYYHSDVSYHLIIPAGWDEKARGAKRAALMKQAQEWGSNLGSALRATGKVMGAYTVTPETCKNPESIWGSNYPKLQQLKGKYDGSNLFNQTANITPKKA